MVNLKVVYELGKYRKIVADEEILLYFLYDGFIDNDLKNYLLSKELSFMVLTNSVLRKGLFSVGKCGSMFLIYKKGGFNFLDCKSILSELDKNYSLSPAFISVYGRLIVKDDFMKVISKPASALDIVNMNMGVVYKLLNLYKLIYISLMYILIKNDV